MVQCMHHPQQLVVWPTMSCFCLYICLSWSSPFYCTAKKPTPYANTSSIRKNDPKHTLKRSKKYSTFAHTTFGGEERFVLFLYFFHGFRNSPFCIKRKMPKIKLQTFWSKIAIDTNSPLHRCKHHDHYRYIPGRWQFAV